MVLGGNIVHYIQGNVVDAGLFKKMQCSRIWLHVGLVRTDVSEERVASVFRVERISELGRTLALSSRQPHCEEALTV
jgi:hypothetical protein